MQSKAMKLLWVVILTVSAFVLGYYLNPGRQNSRPVPPFGMTGRPAPPLQFNP